MKTQACARGLLLAAAVGVMTLIGNAGVARADSDVFGAPGPSLLDQLVTSTPALTVDPSDEAKPSKGSNAVGMYCENRFAHCH
ncbi:hypothetical protein A5730_16295 [Mycobacterium sp. ACS4054]|uniref:hypothetical protein n=1 Tax=Mycobacterium sp. ACS4054 TaxID=1834119 RepID=UPI0007FEC2FD|nr:hypothetical protein [Mycobacterium sp. ACS4054]OBF05660.1 hypothetical protein A5730_16295 [Mycobacterium sp. ACS4054]